MVSRPLTTFRIAYENLRGKAGRTTALVAVVAIMAFSLFGGAILSRSLDNGLSSLEARLGADIAVVPPGSEDDYESIILAGSPANFYLDRGLAQLVADVPGVEIVTTQFYLATLANAACCTTQIQIIGIDYDTDFVIRPWIAQLHQRQIGAPVVGEREVIVGNAVEVNRNNTATFFGHYFNVAARLERTATGMDDTVFMDMDTARELAKTAQEGGYIASDVDIDNAASVMLVRVGSGYEIGEVVENIRQRVPGVGVVASNGIYASMAMNLNFFTGIISTIMIVLGILAVLILAVMFSMIASSRKKEFAVLRTLGATRKKLAGIVLAEAIVISLGGAIVGSALAAAAVFPFGRLIGTQMGMPLLLPSVWESLRLLVIGLMLSVAVGPLAAAYSAFKISRAETYATMREGE